MGATSDLRGTSALRASPRESQSLVVLERETITDIDSSDKVPLRSCSSLCLVEHVTAVGLTLFPFRSTVTKVHLSPLSAPPESICCSSSLEQSFPTFCRAGHSYRDHHQQLLRFSKFSLPSLSLKLPCVLFTVPSWRLPVWQASPSARTSCPQTSRVQAWRKTNRQQDRLWRVCGRASSLLCSEKEPRR